MVVVGAILCLAALIVIHEAGHFGAARLFGMRVKRFSIGFFKPLIEWQPRGSDTVYSLGALPLGGYVQVDGLNPADDVVPGDRKSYANQPLVAKLAMIAAGPAANFLAATAAFFILYLAGIPVPVTAPVVGVADPGGAAAAAGLQSGDQLLTVGGQSVSTWQDMAQAVQSNRGKTIAVDVLRGGAQVQLHLTPDPDTGRIGISQATRLERAGGVGEAAGKAFLLAGETTVGMAVGLWHMVQGQKTTAGVAGPVGIVQLIASSWETGWRALLWLLAQLSLSLCLFNFLPFPALDGGRIVFLTVEAVTRRRVNRTVEGYVHAAGLLLVLGLVLVVTFRDVLHLSR